MIAFARTCDAIAQTPSKTRKIEGVADYIRSLGRDDLRAAVRFLSGNPLAAHDARRLGIGARTLLDAARRVWHPGKSDLATAFRATGDLGEALARIAREPRALGLFCETLTPAALGAMLDELAGTVGKAMGRRREALCERVFRACHDPREVAYVAKILLGELRIGLREGLILDAIAHAFDASDTDVRRAAMANGDVGEVALAAREGRLDSLALVCGKPLAFMLATPIAFGSTYRELASATWLVEDKYDGIRAQAHVTPERISLFSRNLRDVAPSYPEVVAALGSVLGSFILDGELVAVSAGHVLPFRLLQARLQRKNVSADLLRDVPVRYVAFDLLARGDEFLLDLPLAERRAQLTMLLAGFEADVTVTPAVVLDGDAMGEKVLEHFQAARARGNEGLMFKRSDAPYAPGRRGKAWLKLKRELATLDCVVVAVERGHGRRRDVLSDYTFAVRDGAGFAVIGKAYSGLTDVEIADMTAWFESNRLPPDEARTTYERLKLKRHETVVAPQIVVEIAFDVIMRSELHASGYALRFPRIVRLRPDKAADDIDTLSRVADIYAAMLTREAGDGA